MLNLGITEILLIMALVLIVIGPDRLPHFMRWAGQQYGKLRRAADDMRRAFVLEADRQDAEDRYRELQGRRRAAAERKQAEESERPADASEEEEDISPTAQAAPLPGIPTSDGVQMEPPEQDSPETSE